MKRIGIAFALFAIVPPAVLCTGCIDQSGREYRYTVHQDGSRELCFRIHGTDAAAQQLAVETPDGLKVAVSGLTQQDQVTLYSAQVQMYQAQALATLLQGVLAKAGVSTGGAIAAPPALVTKPSAIGPASRPGP